MINREDMLELTRRMTVKRHSFTRVAGSYRDADGEDDGSFNINFLNLSAAETDKNLQIAKAIPFSETNVELKDYAFPGGNPDSVKICQLLTALNGCGLKNDALMDVLYELIAEQYPTGKEYAIFVFHNRYDVPVKGTDHEWMEGSEEVYEFMIGAVCPLIDEYEPGAPEWGFMYPAFTDRSSDPAHIAVFDPDGSRQHMLNGFLGIDQKA